MTQFSRDKKYFLAVRSQIVKITPEKVLWKNSPPPSKEIIAHAELLRILDDIESVSRAITEYGGQWFDHVAHDHHVDDTTRSTT